MTRAARRTRAWPAALTPLTPLTALATLTAAAALAACGSEPALSPPVTVGHYGTVTAVVADAAAREDVFPALTRYAGTAARLRLRSGSPQAQVDAVKDGEVVDLALLPAGRPLDRLRDELVVAPAAVGTLRGVRYWAAPVTARGLALLRFLQSAAGRQALQAGGFEP